MPIRLFLKVASAPATGATNSVTFNHPIVGIAPTRPRVRFVP